jgi:hypothetical protein
VGAVLNGEVNIQWHDPIKARFSLGELLPVGLNAPVENDV